MPTAQVGGLDPWPQFVAVRDLVRQALQLLEAPAPTTVALYRPEPVTPPAAYLAQQMREMEKTNRELAGDPFTILEDGPAGSGG